MSPHPLRNIPSVNELLESPRLRRLRERLSQNVLVTTVWGVLEEVRTEVQHAAAEMTLPSVSELAERVARRISESDLPALRPVINATGLLLPAGLGRAPLAPEALDVLYAAARDYANLELDLSSRQPHGRRCATAEALLQHHTGAEAALVVNNNAGATLLALAALSAGREVLVSRGQLLEMDASYRVADMIAASGARLREVGATNQTRPADYRDAIGEHTAAILLVHPGSLAQDDSEAVSLASLVEIGRRQRIPVIYQIGSGALVDVAGWGLPNEPVVGQALHAGADLVLFSGDKLLGGPQCGIVLGGRCWVERLESHPLARALRIDKLRLAALVATLGLYRKPESARRTIPLLQLLSTSLENLENRASRLAPQMADTPAVASAEAVPGSTFLGSGVLERQPLATWCIALTPKKGSAEDLAAALRTGTPSVVGRTEKDRLLLDLRSVFPRQDQELLAALQALGHASP